MSSKYQVFATEKPEGATTEEAREDLALRYPDYKVEVFERGTQFIAKLTRTAAEGEEEEGKKDIPPFLEEKDDVPAEDGGDDEETSEPPKPKKDKAEEADEGPEDEPADEEDAEEGDEKDKDGKGGSDVAKAIKALDTLKSVLPKLEKQLKGVTGDDTELPDDFPVPGGPGGEVPPPPGVGGPPGLPHGEIGPTPGAPPGAAGHPPFPAPNVNHGLDQRKGPSVGVPTFGAAGGPGVRPDRFVFRPAKNPDGTRVGFAEAVGEIEQHPKYAAYDVNEMKHDERSDQWVAHLKLREG